MENKNIGDIITEKLNSDNHDDIRPLAEATLNMFGNYNEELKGLLGFLNVFGAKFEVSETFISMILNPRSHNLGGNWMRKGLIAGIIKEGFLKRGLKFRQLDVIQVMIHKCRSYPSEISKFRSLMNNYFDYEKTDEDAFIEFVCGHTEEMQLIYDILLKKTKSFKGYKAMILAFESTTNAVAENNKRLMANRLKKAKPKSRTDLQNFPPELLGVHTMYNYNYRIYNTYASDKFDLDEITKNLKERLPREYESILETHLPLEYFRKFGLPMPEQSIHKEPPKSNKQSYGY